MRHPASTPLGRSSLGALSLRSLLLDPAEQVLPADLRYEHRLNLLRHELGIAPSAEIRDLHARMLSSV